MKIATRILIRLAQIIHGRIQQVNLLGLYQDFSLALLELPSVLFLKFPSAL